MHLKDELDEISGVYYYDKDTSLFAIDDERGQLYKIYIRNKVEIQRWKFDEGADFEDISLVDSTFYVLQSNGDIVSFKVLTKDSVMVDECKSPFGKKNEFETLYYDAYNHTLVLLCKDCDQDDDVVSAWAFSPDEHTYSDTPFYTIDSRQVTDQLPDSKERFKPSAAAIHPITKELYIISSVNKALIIADRGGNIKKVLSLNPKIFKQPEGLTFSDKGDLIISNEWAETGPANIMIFKYKSK